MELRMLARGLLVVALDPALNGFDLLPDVVGWVLVASSLGAGSTAARSVGLRRAGACAWGAVLASGVQTAVFFSERPSAILSSGLTAALALVEAVVLWEVLVWTAALPELPRHISFFLRRMAVVVVLLLTASAVAAGTEVVLGLLSHAWQLGGGGPAMAARVLWRLLEVLAGLVPAVALLRLPARVPALSGASFHGKA